MPKRAKQHQIEDISRAKFQLILPREWVFRDKARDYGIDGEVELFDKNGTPQGLVFWVQLKGTESKEKSTILNFDFSIDTLKYYKILDIPVLFVRYSDCDDSIYTKWIHNIDLFSAKENAKTFRIKLVETDKWVGSTSSQIENYLKKVRQLKSGFLHFPMPISLQIEKETINGISTGIIRNKIKRSLRECCDTVIFLGTEDSRVTITLSNKELRVNLLDLSGCSFHHIDLRQKDNFSEEIAKDILIGIAVSLIQIQQIENGGKVIFDNSLQSRLLERPSLLEVCLLPLFNSNFFDSVLKLVGQIIDREGFIKSKIITQISLLFTSNSRNEKKNIAIKNFLNIRLEKANIEKDQQQQGISHYNLGSYFRGKKNYSKSIHHYNMARKFAPIYLKQHYYYREVAGMLFQLGKYKLTSKLYSVSLDIKKDNDTIGLYADSLMFKGNYKKAIISFEEYISKSTNPLDEFILKCIFLKAMVNKYDIGFQTRRSEDANKLADLSQISKSENPVSRLEKALKLDMLSSLVWFNLGISSLESNDIIYTTYCFTMAALVNSNDIEAWRNATIYAFQSNETNNIVPLIVRTAYFFNKEEYLEEVYSFFENQNPHGPINDVIKVIEDILPKGEDENHEPIVRYLDKNGKFKNVKSLIE